MIIQFAAKINNISDTEKKIEREFMKLIQLSEVVKNSVLNLNISYSGNLC